ncbi:MAG: hypothetical protein ABI475_00120 [Methylophilaceae bacterium]
MPALSTAQQKIHIRHPLWAVIDRQGDYSLIRRGLELYRGDEAAGDCQRILESGYDMPGYSSFETAEMSPGQALEHAGKIKAGLVVLYTRFSGSVPALFARLACVGATCLNPKILPEETQIK